MMRDSVYLTVRATAMVCYLFIGSWTFSSVFSYLGGEGVIKEFVLGLDLNPVTFLLLSQLIIFILGWPLEWSEIIIIFVPIFLPLLPHFKIDPIFFGVLVALNLQTSFLTPPMAMSAYYLKGIAPKGIELSTIFRGCMQFLVFVFVTMFLLYTFPATYQWLPDLIEAEDNAFDAATVDACSVEVIPTVCRGRRRSASHCLPRLPSATTGRGRRSEAKARSG